MSSVCMLLGMRVPGVLTDSGMCVEVDPGAGGRRQHVYLGSRRVEGGGDPGAGQATARVSGIEG